MAVGDNQTNISVVVSKRNRDPPRLPLTLLVTSEFDFSDYGLRVVSIVKQPLKYK